VKRLALLTLIAALPWLTACGRMLDRQRGLW
jgi:hypothetical protein